MIVSSDKNLEMWTALTIGLHSEDIDFFSPYNLTIDIRKQRLDDLQ